MKHRKIQRQEQSEPLALQSGLANFEVEKISINVSIKKIQQTMLKKDNKTWTYKKKEFKKSITTMKTHGKTLELNTKIAKMKDVLELMRIIREWKDEYTKKDYEKCWYDKKIWQIMKLNMKIIKMKVFNEIIERGKNIMKMKETLKSKKKKIQWMNKRNILIMKTLSREGGTHCVKFEIYVCQMTIFKGY